MKIIDMIDEYRELYFVCLEDWSDEMKDAGNKKCQWHDKMQGRGVRVKLALDDTGTVGGMIQYAPIETAFVEGEDLYFVYCIWVHGYKQGRGNFQKQGMGKALLAAAESDARERGAKGMVTWGMSLPFWMQASWFKKQGYRKIDKKSVQVLLWKPFTDTAIAPKWIKEKKKPERIPGKVTVTSFVNGWCTAQNIVYERAKRAAAEFGDKVIFQEIDTFDHRTLLEWGHSDALFVDGKEVRTGPPPSYEKLRKLIERRVRRL